MVAVVVALAVQAAWDLAYLLLGENGLGRDRYVGTYAHAIEIGGAGSTSFH